MSTIWFHSGALPLGLIITSDECTKTLTDAFYMFNNMLPADAFFGRGTKGPSMVMTDNADELRDAIHCVWPDATLLLCVFHILQQVNLSLGHIFNEYFAQCFKVTDYSIISTFQFSVTLKA